MSFTTLPEGDLKLPSGLSLEGVPSFVPRMVMTDELRVVMRDVLRQWKHRDLFEGLGKYGIRPLDRLLFYGPPGNGKTMACEWMCRELGTEFYRVRCEQIRSSSLGGTTKAISAITQYLNSVTRPAVCLFDEIESIFVNRSVSVGECDRELGSALTVFFQALDRWRAPTLIVMCTNLHEQLDAALLSRIELQLEFRPPTADQALQVVEYWRELLDEFGASEWGPRFVAWIEGGRVPGSFRELQQAISRSARDWVAGQIPEENGKG